DIEQPVAQFRPDVLAENLRVAERRFGGEMFFERDLALHEVPPGSGHHATPRHGVSASRRQKQKAAQTGGGLKLANRSGRRRRRLVEPGGIEPPTSCMPCRRSPS